MTICLRRLVSVRNVSFFNEPVSSFVSVNQPIMTNLLVLLMTLFYTCYEEFVFSDILFFFSSLMNGTIGIGN